MGLFDRQDESRRWLHLLEAERRALLSGDFRALRHLLSEKERMVARVAPQTMDEATLKRLRDMAQANGALLQAAMSGFREVARDLRSGPQPAAALQTYDVAGRRQGDPSADATVERRF